VPEKCVSEGGPGSVILIWLGYDPTGAASMSPIGRGDGFQKSRDRKIKVSRSARELAKNLSKKTQKSSGCEGNGGEGFGKVSGGPQSRRNIPEGRSAYGSKREDIKRK